MFTEPPDRILVCYICWQTAYDNMKKLGYVEFHEGMPDEQTIREFSSKQNHRLIIFDDMTESLVRHPLAEKLFCVLVHHWHLSVAVLMQNFFHSHMRTLSLQLHYIVLFKLTRDMSQAMCIFRQIAPRQSTLLMNAYEDSVKEPYGYLVIDCSPASRHPYLWRTGVFPGETTYAYVPVREKYNMIVQGSPNS